MARRKLPKINYDQIVSRMFQNSISATHIAKLLDVSESFVYNRLKATGTPTKTRVGVPREA